MYDAVSVIISPCSSDRRWQEFSRRCLPGGAFFAVYLVYRPLLNIGLMIVAIMTSNGASTILWGMYCTSLKDTDMVSGATRFLNFASYIAASLSSAIFANSVDTIGWGNLILVWAGLMALGVAITIPYKKRGV